jgi:hypothetical protein
MGISKECNVEKHCEICTCVCTLSMYMYTCVCRDMCKYLCTFVAHVLAYIQMCPNLCIVYISISVNLVCMSIYIGKCIWM